METPGENQNNFYYEPNQYGNVPNNYQFPPTIQGNPSTSYATPSSSHQSTYTNLNTYATKTTDELLNFVLKELEDLKTSSANLTEIVTRIDEKLEIRTQDENLQAEPPEGFPLQSMDEFNAFENAGRVRHEALKGHLEFLGGQNLKEAFNNFIRATMTNELARNFSWTGKSSNNDKPNVALYKTRLMKIFLAAAKRIPRIQKFNLQEFKSNFSDTLRSYKQIALNKRNQKKKGSRKQMQQDEMALFGSEDSEENDENMVDV